jgi:hypothetical protein
VKSRLAKLRKDKSWLNKDRPFSDRSEPLIVQGGSFVLRGLEGGEVGVAAQLHESCKRDVLRDFSPTS